MATITPAQEIEDIIRLYGGWKGRLISELRSIIVAAAPDIEEAVKWRMASRPEGLPVWSSNGIVCLNETFKNDMKLVFTKGKFLKDPEHLFNARLQSKTDRAIQFIEGSTINKQALAALVKEAVHFNLTKQN